MFIHREEYYHTREEAQEKGIAGQADVIVAKQRNGPTGDVKLAWFDKYTRFENLSQKPYEEFGDSSTAAIQALGKIDRALPNMRACRVGPKG